MIAFADYFKIFGLRLSITILRQMLETAYFDALQRNVITEEQYYQVSIFII